jgi:hypothetical protein
LNFMADAHPVEHPESPETEQDVIDSTPAPEENVRRRFDKLAALAARVSASAPQVNLGQIASLITIPVFCWVFFTTWSGMIDIMRRETYDWIGVLGSLIGTTAILVMLASTSLSLGADLGALIARRQFLGERIVIKTLVTSSVFLFVFSMSAFFSFTYYYTNIFRLSSKKIVSEMQPLELAAEVLLPASKQINENYEANAARIVSMPGMNAYLESLDALLQMANNNAGSNFREEMRKNQDRLQRAALEAAKKTAAELQDIQATGRQIEETRSKISALTQIVNDLDPIIKSKQDEIVSLTSTERQEDQLAVDASKGLDGLGAACGPNCKSHEGKATAARRRIAVIRQTLTAPLNDRANAIKQRDALNAQLVTLRQKVETASLAPAAVLKEDTSFDLDATLRQLTDLRNQIRSDPTWSKIRQAKASCNQILVTARQLNLLSANVQSDFDCEPSDASVHDFLTARDELIASRAAFKQRCSLDGDVRESLTAIAHRIRNTPEVDTTAPTAFNDAKQIVDACLVSGKTAGLSELDVQALLKRSDAFLRSHSMERNRFELAREAFMSATPDATMAISVAVAQDAFIFVMKLLSEIFKRETKTREGPALPPAMDVTDGEEDDPDIRVMKALLRASRPLHGDMSAFDPNAESVRDLPENVRENLVGLLNRLVREETAYLDGKGIYVIENRTLIEVESRLETALKRAAARAMANAEKAARSDAFAFGGSEYRRRRDFDAMSRPRRRSALERYLSPARTTQSDESDLSAEQPDDAALSAEPDKARITA